MSNSRFDYKMYMEFLAETGNSWVAYYKLLSLSKIPVLEFPSDSIGPLTLIDKQWVPISLDDFNVDSSSYLNQRKRFKVSDYHKFLLWRLFRFRSSELLFIGSSPVREYLSMFQGVSPLRAIPAIQRRFFYHDSYSLVKLSLLYQKTFSLDLTNQLLSFSFIAEKLQKLSASYHLCLMNVQTIYTDDIEYRILFTDGDYWYSGNYSFLHSFYAIHKFGYFNGAYECYCSIHSYN